MAYLSVIFDAVPSNVNLDDIIEAFRRSIPGTAVTTLDWYGRLREETRLTVERLRSTGSFIDEDVIDTVDRAKLRHPRTMGLFIPSPRGGLDGRISREGMLLHGELVDADILKFVESALESLGISNTLQYSNIKSPWSKRND